MTDELAPDAPGSGDLAQTQVPPPAAKPSSNKRPIIIVGLIVAFLAVVLFLTRNNAAADDLAVGECFNIPDGTTIQTVEKHGCTESHNAEVIFVGAYDGTTFPISLSLERYIEDNCVPAFASYVGRAIDTEPALSVGYFYPTREGWDDGDRTVTCYVSQPDESPMTESLKG